MRSFGKILAAAAFLTTAACVYPTSSTTQGGVSSALSFAGLPPTASLMVDGAAMGSAQDYATKVLAVAPGTHRVVVTNAGSIIIDRDVYVGRDSTVKVAQ